MEIWDPIRGTTTRAADPPAGFEFGSGSAGISDAAVDDDVYFDGSTKWRPGGAPPPVSNVVRYDSKANRWDLLPPPAGIGNNLADYDWAVTAGRPTLLRARYDRTRPEPSGAILGTDGSWHFIPVDPFAGDKYGAHLVSSGDQLLALGGAERIAKVAILNVAANGHVGQWKPLPAITGTGARGTVTAVDGLLVWHDLVYDPRTGRSVPTPETLRDRATSDASSQSFGGRQVSAPDGLVLGDRVTLSGALFDPRTRTWTDLPTPPNHEPAATGRPARPDSQTRSGQYDWVGGKQNIVRLYEGDTVVDGTGKASSMTYQPGKVDVLAVKR